jgi:hypothetical protein
MMQIAVCPLFIVRRALRASSIELRAGPPGKRSACRVVFAHYMLRTGLADFTIAVFVTRRG